MPRDKPDTIIIREASPSDAKALNKYMREIYRSAEHLITRPAEFRIGPWRHRFWISKKLSSPIETCLLATTGDQIVGMLDSWTDPRKRVKHSTCFSMSVDANWQRKGIGTTLLQYFIDWVKKHPSLKRIELHVHSDNTHALALYKACGFKLEGTRRKAVKYEDGRVVDDHIMALWPTKH